LTRKSTLFLIVVIAAVVAAAAAILTRVYRWKPSLTTIQGAVIRSEKDADKQVPVPDAIVTASRGEISTTTHSDASGYFRITFPEVIWPGQTLLLTVQHSEFYALDIPLAMQFRSSSRRLIIAALKPLSETKGISADPKADVVSNIRVRYTVNSKAEANVGSAVRTFQVINQGDVPCRRQGPCSPDGVWKAAMASVTMDAGTGNEFRNVRASCIAGPCPFTRIDSQGFERGGRMITASALNWSDTATFLLEAEVFHTAIASSVRESYPVIFDRTLNFTLPGTEEGVSIEAEINGVPTVFPLGPDSYLRWASCTLRNAPASESTVYQCELKPGYRF
jgi:hypothetical protein